MSHAFRKKSAKTPAKDLRIARDRMKEVRTNADT
jgi:phage-related protein